MRIRHLLPVLLLLPSVARAQAPGSSPFSVSLTYTADLAANVHGGAGTGVVGLGNLDAILRVDGGRLLGWPGVTLFVYGLANHGGKPSDLVGDAQTVDDIQAPAAARLYEAWVQTNLPGAGLSVLAGLYDVNSEFDVVDEASVFLNSSFGIGAAFGNSGVNGPSIFPVTSLGTRLEFRPWRRLNVRAAVLDGVPGDPSDPDATAIHLSHRDGALWVAEVGYPVPVGENGRGAAGRLGRQPDSDVARWRVAVGLWQYTRRSEPIGGGEAVRGHPGAYALVEGRPWPEDDPSQGAGVFVQLGAADPRTNRFAAYTGAGFTYTGLLPGRDQDEAGIGVAAAWNGGRWARAREAADSISPAGAETTVELTYQAVVSPTLTLQPDAQLVLRPGTNPALGNALLLTLRGSLSL